MPPIAGNVQRMFVDPVAIKALHMLGEIETLISTTTPLPDNRTARCMELLEVAKALTNELMKRGSRNQERTANSSPPFFPLAHLPMFAQHARAR